MNAEYILAFVEFLEKQHKWLEKIVITQNTIEGDPNKGKMMINKEKIKEHAEHIEDLKNKLNDIYERSMNENTKEIQNISNIPTGTIDAELEFGTDLNHYTTEQKKIWIQNKLDEEWSHKLGTMETSILDKDLTYEEAIQIKKNWYDEAEIPTKGSGLFKRLDFDPNKCCFKSKHPDGNIPNVINPNSKEPMPCDECKYLVTYKKICDSMVNRFKNKKMLVPFKDLTVDEKFLVVRHRYKILVDTDKSFREKQIEKDIKRKQYTQNMMATNTTTQTTDPMNPLGLVLGAPNVVKCKFCGALCYESSALCPNPNCQQPNPAGLGKRIGSVGKLFAGTIIGLGANTALNTMTYGMNRAVQSLPIVCPNCGYQNQGTARFCAQCNTSLIAQQQPMQQTQQPIQQTQQQQ